MTGRIRAKATAIVTLEIDVAGGGWLPDATVEQVHTQGRDAAIEAIRQLLLQFPLRTARLVGSPRVVGVTFEKDEP